MKKKRNITYVRIVIHDGRTNQIPFSVIKSKVRKHLIGWKSIHYEVAKEINADYFIYCTQTFNKENELVEVNLMGLAINKDELPVKVNLINKKEDETVYFCCWKKGKDY